MDINITIYYTCTSLLKYNMGNLPSCCGKYPLELPTMAPFRINITKNILTEGSQTPFNHNCFRYYNTMYFVYEMSCLHSEPTLVVGKGRFWDSSIFRIGFSFDDVTSTRGSRDDLWRRRFWVILVRRWWSRAAVFHCDILHP